MSARRHSPPNASLGRLITSDTSYLSRTEPRLQQPQTGEHIPWMMTLLVLAYDRKRITRRDGMTRDSCVMCCCLPSVTATPQLHRSHNSSFSQQGKHVTIWILNKPLGRPNRLPYPYPPWASAEQAFLLTGDKRIACTVGLSFLNFYNAEVLCVFWHFSLLNSGIQNCCMYCVPVLVIAKNPNKVLFL